MRADPMITARATESEAAGGALTDNPGARAGLSMERVKARETTMARRAQPNAIESIMEDTMLDPRARLCDAGYGSPKAGGRRAGEDPCHVRVGYAIFDRTLWEEP